MVRAELDEPEPLIEANGTYRFGGWGAWAGPTTTDPVPDLPGRSRGKLRSIGHDISQR